MNCPLDMSFRETILRLPETQSKTQTYDNSTISLPSLVSFNIIRHFIRCDCYHLQLTTSSPRFWLLRQIFPYIPYVPIRKSLFLYKHALWHFARASCAKISQPIKDMAEIKWIVSTQCVRDKMPPTLQTALSNIFSSTKMFHFNEVLPASVPRCSFYHDMQISWPDSGSPPIRLSDS